MATSKSSIADKNILSSLVAEWIATLLGLNETSLVGTENFELTTPSSIAQKKKLCLEDDNTLDLRRLHVKDLKKICKEINRHMLRYEFSRSNPRSSLPISFSAPKSSARKSELIDAVANFFSSGSGLQNDILGIPSEPAAGGVARLGKTKRTVLSPESAVADNSKKSRLEFSKQNEQSLLTSHARKLPHSPKSPSAMVIKRSAGRKTSYALSSKAKEHKVRHKPFVSSSTTSNTKTKSNNTKSAAQAAMEAADEAMARSLQQQLFNENENGMTDCANDLSVGSGDSCQIFYENTSQPLHSSTANTPAVARLFPTSEGSRSDEIFGTGARVDSKFTNSPIKIKKEPNSPSRTIHKTNSSTTACTASHSTTSSDSPTPQNFREQAMADSLRSMGFTNMREILTGLRAVAKQRDEVAVVTATIATGLGAPASNHEWSTQEQVEAAMMWIVNQREEEAEARKLDEARISSEIAEAATERLRREQEGHELKHAALIDLIGSVGGKSKGNRDDDLVGKPSKFFSDSIVLRHGSAKRVFTAVASSPAVSYQCRLLGREQVIRFLSLEKKAKKWYGTVLPFSYFEYISCPRFKGWANKLLPCESVTCSAASCSELRENLSKECDELEKALYNLSEQDEGGVGNVPKVFLAAQKDASRMGKHISPMEVRKSAGSDGEVKVLEFPCTLPANGVEAKDNQGAGKSSCDIIEIL